jgi:hypothetical protein
LVIVIVPPSGFAGTATSVGTTATGRNFLVGSGHAEDRQERKHLLAAAFRALYFVCVSSSQDEFLEYRVTGFAPVFSNRHAIIVTDYPETVNPNLLIYLMLRNT